MGIVSRLIVSGMVLLSGPVVALCEPLKCSVSISDSKAFNSFVPQTEFGRRFSKFTLDLSRDPDDSWQHQNLCVTREDFKGAQFTGSICLIVMSTRSPATPTGLPALYMDVWSGIATRPSNRGLGVSEGRMFSDSEIVIPINLNAQELRWRQFFTIKKSRDLAQISISCTPE